MKTIPFRIKFLVSILIVYLLVSFYDPILVKDSFVSTVKLFINILPLLAFIFVLNVLVNKYLTAEIVKKYVGDQRGAGKWFYAIILGIIISGPPYMLYPMLGDIKKHGASDAFLATMLFNRNVKIPFIPAMIYYFGMSYTVIVSLLVILFSLLNGYLVSILSKPKTE